VLKLRTVGGYFALEEQQMCLVYEERLSDAPCVELITHGRTTGAGRTIRPAECQWHLVLVKYEGKSQAIVTGPLRTSGVVSWTEGAEILWIKFKLGTFIPHLPPRKLLDVETPLPEAASNSFWLKGSAWQFPNYENADTFVERLVRANVLVQDKVVSAALQDQLPEMSSRTVRHRFLQTTGLTQNHIRQYERAQQAARLLQQGVSILDTVFELGYFDQPHLTRSLKQFIGHTPAQLARLNNPD
jgi:AraC-like DNA-binding protein